MNGLSEIDQWVRTAQQYHAQGKLGEAELLYRKALAARADHPEAMCGLGVLACQAGRHEEALECLRPEWIEQANNPLLLVSRAVSLQVVGRGGRVEEALRYARRAVALDPDYAAARNVLGGILFGMGTLAEAVEAYGEAVWLAPEDAEIRLNLGTALQAWGKDKEAVEAYRAGLALKPAAASEARARLYLCEALPKLGLLEDYEANLKALEAMATGSSGVEENVDALHGWSLGLAERGRIEEAVALLERVVAARPGDAKLHSRLVYLLQLHPDASEQRLADEAALWNQYHAAALVPAEVTFANDPTADRRLRVGYVSPDFYSHAEARFVLPLFAAHDRAQVEIHAYSSVHHPDDMTQRIRGAADVWHEVRSLSDAVLAEKIRADGIDILIDLTMHTTDNRLLMFARRPAPIQMTWLAYPGRTGLSAIDFRITDARLDPPGVTDLSETERPLRLPDCWCCYQPAADAPDPGPLPAGAAGPITFGSFNSFRKMSARVLALWAGVLHTVPDSTLIMTCPRGEHRAWVREVFVRSRIDPARIKLTEPVPYADYLRQYQTIDIALDPLPHNGLTTTCDALWMGVPVLSLTGQTMVGRAGLSLLTAAGLADLASTTTEEFLRKAMLLSADRVRLRALRGRLREQLRSSPLLDAGRFAHHLELAYRTAWQMWCRSK